VDLGGFEFAGWDGGRVESESVFESDSVPELGLECGGVTLSAGAGLVENGSEEEREVMPAIE
jgi:hypothetical protein